MRTVHELNIDELEELRGAYFAQLDECGDEDVLGDITEPEDIPMGNVIAHYEDVYFVEDDFFCNQ